jgi:hypothetical protein
MDLNFSFTFKSGLFKAKSWIGEMICSVPLIRMLEIGLKLCSLAFCTIHKSPEIVFVLDFLMFFKREDFLFFGN